MNAINRRAALKVLLASGGASVAGADTAVAAAAPGRCDKPAATTLWSPGIEGQRRADLGNGRYLNPVVAGDHPDPTILRDGADYYLTFSSFDALPGLVIWHSSDLLNWQPLAAVLQDYVGSVWAPELCKHGNHYYIYFHARTAERRDLYVIHAEHIPGPWSAPLPLALPRHIDPGHMVGEDGKRYLFLSGGDRVRLSADGLATDGAVEHVYDCWRYPEDWDVESLSPEGPKLFRRGQWFYMLTAIGGTAGPPTGHMVIVARSRSVHGPWQAAPHNPLLRTRSTAERWWSRGHASLVDAPDGSSWLLYHGYENGYWTLGRQTLLEPVEWTADGWLRCRGGDLSQPLAKPRAAAVAAGTSAAHGMALSDDFSTDKLGVQWAFYDPGPQERARLRRAAGTLVLAAKGSTPADSSPLCFVVGDQHYRVSVDIEIDPQARGGLLLFYNRRLYCGLGFDAEGLLMHRYGLERRMASTPGLTRRLSLRITNNHHIVTIHHRVDGAARWSKFGVQMEVSGYHHNVAYDFLSLRPAVYAAGNGEVRFSNVVFEALPESAAGDRSP